MDHPIPDEALETDIAILAMKGAGKSVLAKSLAERVIGRGRRFIAIDPLSHWWGLKVRADGSPGFPIAVLGGRHGDVKITPDQGAELGEFLAKSDVSAILDIADWRKADYVRFVTDFLDALYVHNERALWLALEEADMFAPQNPSMDGTRQMADTVDLIARRGRQRGFRLWTITQRPARLAKDVLNMASTLVTLRTMGPLDRKAAEDWYLAHTDRKTARDIGATLAGLETGEGWIFSPENGLQVRAKFPMMQSLDTSYTPKAGEERAKNLELAKVELGELKAFLGGLDRKKAADLRANIDHQTLPQQELILADNVALEASYRRGVEDGKVLGMSAALAEFDKARAAVCKLLNEAPPDTIAPPVLPPLEHPAVPPPPKPQPIEVYEKTIDTTTPLTSAAAKLADGLTRYPTGLTWKELGVVSGLMSGNGHFNVGRKTLIERGLARDEGGIVTATEALIELAGGRRRPLTRHDFKEMWGGRRQPGPRMFSVLCDAAGGWVTIDELAAAVDLKTGNGYWNTGLSVLDDANLIERDGKRVRVIDLIGRAAA